MATVAETVQRPALRRRGAQPLLRSLPMNGDQELTDLAQECCGHHSAACEGP